MAAGPQGAVAPPDRVPADPGMPPPRLCPVRPPVRGLAWPSSKECLFLRQQQPGPRESLPSVPAPPWEPGLGTFLWKEECARGGRTGPCQVRSFHRLGGQSRAPGRTGPRPVPGPGPGSARTRLGALSVRGWFPSRWPGQVARDGTDHALGRGGGAGECPIPPSGQSKIFPGEPRLKAHARSR